MLPPHLARLLKESDVHIPEVGSVLLVDDEPSNLDVLATLLEDPWQVHTALDAEGALGFLSQQGPVDLVITDQRMPGMTGVDLLKEVARLSPDTIRMVITGYSDLEPMLDAVNQDLVYCYITKPPEPLEMRLVVEEAMRRRITSLAMGALLSVLSRRRASLARTLGELDRAHGEILMQGHVAMAGRLVGEVRRHLEGQVERWRSVRDELAGAREDARLCDQLEALLRQTEALAETLGRASPWSSAGSDLVEAHMGRDRVLMDTMLSMLQKPQYPAPVEP